MKKDEREHDFICGLEIPPHSTRTRSLVKAIIYRALSIMLTMLIVYAVTRKVEIALIVMALDAVVMTAAYYLYERIWQRIKWGRLQ